MEQLLGTNNWDHFYLQDEPNVLWELLLGYITKAIDEMCPMKTFKKYKEPWISQELLELIKDKDASMKKAKRTQDGIDWTRAKRLRNDCLSKVRKAKAEFINSELNNNQADSKKFWKNIHDIITTGKNSQKNIHLINQTLTKKFLR